MIAHGPAAALGRLLRAPLRLLLGVAAGLFLARELGEIVPDALAIGVSMFAAGYFAAERRSRSNAEK